MKKIIEFLGENRTLIFSLAFLFLFGVMVGATLDDAAESRAYHYFGPVTYNEVVEFLNDDDISERGYSKEWYNCRNFALDTVNRAIAQGINCAYVIIPGDGNTHAIVAFNTSDMGIVYFEPQNDCRLFPEYVLYTKWY